MKRAGESLAGRVARLATMGVAVALLLAGLLTSGALFAAAHSSQDRALVTAARSRAKLPRVAEGERWLPHGLGPEVTVAVWPDQAVPVPEPMLVAQLRSESDARWHVDGMRVVAVTTHRQGDAAAGVPLSAHPHALVVAWAPELGVVEVIAPFLAVYLPLAALVALAVGLIQVRAVRAELVPLDEAVRGLGGVDRLGAGAVVREAGPEEVRAVIAAVNGLLSRLDAAHAAQGAFVSSATHELRTPVALLVGEIELLLRRERDAQALRDGLVRLQEDAARLARLVDALLALARVDAGEIERALQLERASALVAGALRGHVPAPEAARVSVDTAVDPEVRVHVALVEMALGNLIRNAIVHGRPPVRVGVEAGAGQLRVRVSDAGPGVPAADRERVFARFERGVVGGLGLGLPLAREVARRHGGDCVISMEHPSEFVFTLPL